MIVAGCLFFFARDAFCIAKVRVGRYFGHGGATLSHFSHLTCIRGRWGGGGSPKTGIPLAADGPRPRSHIVFSCSGSS